MWKPVRCQQPAIVLKRLWWPAGNGGEGGILGRWWGGGGGARFIERGTVNYGRWLGNDNGGTEGVMCTTNGDIGNIRV